MSTPSSPSVGVWELCAYMNTEACAMHQQTSEVISEYIESMQTTRMVK